MNFSFVYVDDEADARNLLKEYVQKHNSNNPEILLTIKTATNPDELKQQLHEDDDVVVADVFWGKHGKEEDRLNDVINAVKAWSSEHNLKRPIPIIAYTGFGEAALASCLERRADLLDIWDKHSASPAYVAWRLSRLAEEFKRLKPDSVIQRLVRQVSPGARWQRYVRDMTTEYSAGLTETDQIRRAGDAIAAIGHQLNVWKDGLESMWEVMKQWEPLSRAVSRSGRGHARHVINVFWLGYYLLHNEHLLPFFEEAWSRLLEERIKALEVAVRRNASDAELRKRLEAARQVRRNPARESLSDCWFYAAIFHDVAGCIQKYSTMRAKTDGLVGTFAPLIPKPSNAGKWLPGGLNGKAERILKDYEESMAAKLKRLWKRSIDAAKPDHGVLAALQIHEIVTASEQRFLAYEATRAMAVHNLIGELDNSVDKSFTWDSEPIICLLLLCDQIQTWDRERGDETLDGPDDPERAQLTSLKIEKKKNGRPMISMSIDYIALRHLDRDPVLFSRIKSELEKVLRDRPCRALTRLGTPWPFDVSVECRLNGHDLAHGMNFGSTSSPSN